MAKRRGQPIDGWLAIDKPAGLTSAAVVARVRKAFDAAKAGHAGTLDPIATGMLPIALGEATKTVAYVQDSRKTYEFTVRWGVATDTDDCAGAESGRSSVRPTPEAIRAALPALTAEEAQRLRHGQAVALFPVAQRNPQVAISQGSPVQALLADRLVAIAEVGPGMLQPVRVINAPQT